MVASAAPAPDALYAGQGPPGDGSYNCQPIDAEGSALYEAVPVDAAAFATVERRRGNP